VAALVEDPATEGPAPGPTDGDGPDDDGFADLDRDQPERFRAFLDGLDAEPATLHYLHLLLPHVPYRYLPSGSRYESPDPDVGRLGDDWSDDPWPAQLGRQRLQLQLAHVDALVGQLTETLRARGLWDDALVVLTADHGIAFEPGGPIRGIEGQPLTDEQLAELAWVPLFVKEPGQTTGTVRDEPVETVDVVPTVADVLDVELPWPVDGRSLLGDLPDERDRPFHPSDVNAFGVASLAPRTLDGDVGRATVRARGTDRLLPALGTADRFFRFGPRPDLVGTAVDDARPGTLVPLAVRLDDAEALAVVDPASGRVPALVRGLVDPAELDGAPVVVAVAVDGVVAATAPAYRDGDDRRIAVMVDDGRLGPGPHTVTFHRVADEPVRPPG
jgi:hypothetical protein